MNEQFFDSDSFTPRARELVKNAVTLAGSWGHTYIGTEHILLSAAYEEDSTACAVLLRHEVTAQRIEEQIEYIIGRGTPCRLTKNDITPNAAAVLKGAKRLCESMGGGIAGTEYILAMILRRSDCCAFEILQQLGVNCNRMYNDCSLSGNEPNIFSDRNYPKLKTLERYGRELTRKSECEKFDPCIGREAETERIMEILCRRTKNNPCLVGEAGVGKTAVVEGLARKIMLGEVPSALSSKRIFSLDITALLAGAKYRGTFHKKVFYLYRPALSPYLISACKSALGMAFKSGIAAEVIGVPDFSIGANLYEAKIYLDTASLFAWTLAIILIASCFEKILLRLMTAAGGKGNTVHEKQ